MKRIPKTATVPSVRLNTIRDQNLGAKFLRQGLPEFASLRGKGAVEWRALSASSDDRMLYACYIVDIDHGEIGRITARLHLSAGHYTAHEPCATLYLDSPYFRWTDHSVIEFDDKTDAQVAEEIRSEFHRLVQLIADIGIDH